MLSPPSVPNVMPWNRTTSGRTSGWYRGRSCSWSRPGCSRPDTPSTRSSTSVAASPSSGPRWLPGSAPERASRGPTGRRAGGHDRRRSVRRVAGPTRCAVRVAFDAGDCPRGGSAADRAEPAGVSDADAGVPGPARLGRTARTGVRRPARAGTLPAPVRLVRAVPVRGVQRGPHPGVLPVRLPVLGAVVHLRQWRHRRAGRVHLVAATRGGVVFVAGLFAVDGLLHPVQAAHPAQRDAVLRAVHRLAVLVRVPGAADGRL